jgi:hypothetical protein
LQPPYTWDYFVWRDYYFHFHIEEKNQLYATEIILLEEKAKYDDTIELKEEQRNALFVFDGTVGDLSYYTQPN